MTKRLASLACIAAPPLALGALAALVMFGSLHLRAPEPWERCGVSLEQYLSDATACS